jgi:APA family basic amino acid/polyamine antiporter
MSGVATKTQPAAAGFQQRLGLFDATMLVAGSMIGSGIFLVSTEIARDVGSSGWLLLVWGVTGVLTIIGALSYAELAAMMPHAGGQYVYLREAYSPFWGFLYGWALFLVIQTGTIAAVAVSFAKFLGVFFPELGTSPDAGARTLLKVDNLDWNIALKLPWTPEKVSFYERKDFTITLGQFVAVGVIAFLTLWNCFGVLYGKWVQNTFTVAKTLALILLILVGLFVASSDLAAGLNTKDYWAGATETKQYQAVSKLVPWSGLGVVLMVAGGAMVGALFSADAWANVTFTAGEVHHPRRNLPLSLIIGAGGVILLYLLANVAYLASLPLNGDKEITASLDEQAAKVEDAGNEALADDLRRSATFWRGIDHAKDDRVGTAVFELVSPRYGARFMAAAIMVSLFGCANGLVLMGARLYYAMSRDGLFFRPVGLLNARGVPAVGLVLQGIWACLLVFSGTYSDLLDYVIFAALLFYVLTVAGLFVLRYKQPFAERPYRALGYPLVPALYVLVAAAIMLNLLIVKPKYTWPGLIIVCSGIPVYFLWRRGACHPPTRRPPCVSPGSTPTCCTSLSIRRGPCRARSRPAGSITWSCCSFTWTRTRTCAGSDLPTCSRAAAGHSRQSPRTTWRPC